MRIQARSLVLAAVTALAASGAARAADGEPIPADFLQQFAPFAAQLFQQQFPNPPVKVDVDATKVAGYHVQEKVGVVFFPDKNLSAETLKGAGEKEVPVGILATKSFALRDKDAAVPVEKVAMANLMDQLKIPLYYLAVKSAGEDRSLLVYSKDAKPLATVPLKKQDGDASQPVALKLANVELDKKTGDLKVTVTGSHEATVPLAVVDY